MDEGQHPVFGDLLRQARRSARLTHEMLAERAGLSVRGISDLERGIIRSPRKETLEMLAGALNLSEEERREWEELRRRLAARTATTPSSGDTWLTPPAIPVPLTPLIGREHEICEVLELAETHHTRLVTLTGPGGVGKTRIALEVARRMQSDFRGGIHIVNMASFSNPALVLPTIATTLQIQSGSGQPLPAAITAALSQRKLLLVLDNMEHVVEAARDIAEVLLHCPCMHVLATSRVPLHVQGEHEYPVFPFALLSGGDLDDIDLIMDNPAVRLFVERARDVAAHFHITRENASVVAAICQRLDGLPLAIELAASHMRMFTPHGLHQRLEPRLPLLVSDMVDLPARHRTLRETIAWSYDLLSHDERILFRRLSVFRGGWTHDAVGAVTGHEVSRGIERLVSHSLVLVQPQPNGDMRFGMLETIREFGAELLAGSGEEQLTRDKHAAYITALAEAADPYLEMADQVLWLERLVIEEGNLVAALDWIRKRKSVELGLRLVKALRVYWYLRGNLEAGFEDIISITSMPESSAFPALCIDALNSAALLARENGNLDGAYAVTRKSLTLCHELNDRKRAADAMANLGYVSLQRGNVEGAEDLFRRSLATNRELNNQQGIADSLSFLALAAAYQDDLVTAQRLNEESLDIWNRLDDRHGTVWARTRLGSVLAGQMLLADAYVHFIASLEIARELNFRMGMSWALEGLSNISARHGNFSLAARLAAAATTLGEAVGMRLPPVEQAEHERLLHQIRQEVGTAAFDEIWSQRSDVTLEELVREIESRLAQPSNRHYA